MLAPQLGWSVLPHHHATFGCHGPIFAELTCIANCPTAFDLAGHNLAARRLNQMVDDAPTLRRTHGDLAAQYLVAFSEKIGGRSSFCSLSSNLVRRQCSLCGKALSLTSSVADVFFLAMRSMLRFPCRPTHPDANNQ